MSENGVISVKCATRVSVLARLETEDENNYNIDVIDSNQHVPTSKIDKI